MQAGYKEALDKAITSIRLGDNSYSYEMRRILQQYADSGIRVADWQSGYVKVDCGNGVVLRFQHLKKGSVTVENGDQVKAGQVIGYMGLTGNTSGYHLHFDICINGTYVDPKPYLTGAKSLPGATPAGKPAPGNYVV